MVPEVEGPPINLLFGNIRGLMPLCRKRSKIEFLSDIASISNNKMIILSESHLSDKIKDCEISIDNYVSHRCDRKDGTHGGVIIYTAKDIKATKVI